MAQLLAGEVNEDEIDGPRPVFQNSDNDTLTKTIKEKGIEGLITNSVLELPSLRKSAEIERDDEILTEVYNPSPTKSFHSSQEGTEVITPTQPYHEEDENDDILITKLQSRMFLEFCTNKIKNLYLVSHR